MSFFSSFNEIMSNKGQDGGKHYLITTAYKIWEQGSIFRIMGNIIYDCDTRGYEIFYGNSPITWIELSDDDSKRLLLTPRNERVSVYNKVDKKIVKTANLKSEINIDGVTNYLLTETYQKWIRGSIFEVKDNTFYDCDRKDYGVFDDKIPSSWIELSQINKKFLLTKKRIDRVPIYDSGVLENNTPIVTAPPTLPARSINTIKKEVPSTNSIAKPPETDLRRRNIYFEHTLIQPNSVYDNKKIISDYWNIGKKVWFRLAESFLKYEGTLKWTGLINDVNAVFVELDLLKASDSILLYRCSLDLCSLLGIQVFKPTVIVVLSAIQHTSCNHIVMEKYFNKMFGFVTDAALSTDIFNDVLELNDATLSKSLLNSCPSQCLPDLCLKTILKSINDQNKDLIIEMINKIDATQNDNLLKLAPACLTTKKESLFRFVIDKCKNKNSLLDNGETFLTNLIKSNVDEQQINRILELDLFDVNKPNSTNETPLALVCGRIFVSSVRLLVDLNCNVDHDNGKAMGIAFAAKKTASNMDQLKKVIEIIEILNTKPKTETNICTICMDRKLNIVFGCGHTCCKECSDRLIICATCSRRIVSRIPLFLD